MTKPSQRSGIHALTAGGVTFVVSVLVFSALLGHSILGGARIPPHHGRIQRPQMTLAANVNFSITSAVASTPSCTGAALLLPGAPDFLCYTVHNPFTQSITVTSMSVSSTTSSAASCPISNLDMASTAYSGTPALVVAAHGAATVGEPISMVTSNTNQDACLGTTFTFANVGKARFTTTPPTSTTTTTTTTATTSTAGSSTPSPPAGSSTPTSPSVSTLAFTGADIASMIAAGVLAIAVGLLIMAAARRRRRREVDQASEYEPS
ncbi:MAG TPA: hypothetical protein VMB82_01150 [Acidimicrobiales bacterium]|nr:hypothetical protein [Acidimicrobiales bacterium]